MSVRGTGLAASVVRGDEYPLQRSAWSIPVSLSAVPWSENLGYARLNTLAQTPEYYGYNNSLVLRNVFAELLGKDLFLLPNEIEFLKFMKLSAISDVDIGTRRRRREIESCHVDVDGEVRCDFSQTRNLRIFGNSIMQNIDTQIQRWHKLFPGTGLDTTALKKKLKEVFTLENSVATTIRRAIPYLDFVDNSQNAVSVTLAEEWNPHYDREVGNPTQVVQVLVPFSRDFRSTVIHNQTWPGIPYRLVNDRDIDSESMRLNIEASDALAEMHREHDVALSPVLEPGDISIFSGAAAYHSSNPSRVPGSIFKIYSYQIERHSFEWDELREIALKIQAAAQSSTFV